LEVIGRRDDFHAENDRSGSLRTAFDCLADTMVARIQQRKEKPPTLRKAMTWTA
jgi:hypothetical protein